MIKIIKTKKHPTKVTNAQFGIILEDIQDKFSLVIEGHTVLDKKIDHFKKDTDEKFGIVFDFVKYQKEFNAEVKDFMSETREFQEETKANFKGIFDYLIRIDEELQSIRSEIKELRAVLDKKADKERLEKVEKRVAYLETIIEKHKLSTQTS